jgi:hypothetical protein
MNRHDKVIPAKSPVDAASILGKLHTECKVIAGDIAGVSRTSPFAAVRIARGEELDLDNHARVH